MPLRTLSRLALNALLLPEFIRRRILFQLAQRHYDEFDIIVPICDGLSCPVSRKDHWSSFSEIFFEQEYGTALEMIEQPIKRWIDIGCHAGFFSLLLLSRLRQSFREAEALLLDADPRVCIAIEKMIKVNQLQGKFRFASGAIATGSEQIEFSLASVMSSSLREGGKTGEFVRVPIVTSDEIAKLLPPPYDLIKADIEGAEYHLLTAYDTILRHTKYLLLEWHSWQAGGGGSSQILELASTQGFKLIGEPVVPHSVNVNDQVGECGMFLFSRIN